MTASGEGWYRDPQDARLLRWWTGTMWTEHTAPVPVAASAHPALAAWWPRLAVAVQLALGLNIAVAAFVFYVDLEVLAFADQVRTRPGTVTVAQGERVDWLLLLSSVEFLTYVLTGVLVIVWLYTAHHSARMHRQALRHKSGWAIGGWFVPILCLWRPFQIVTDVKRGATDRSWLGASTLQGFWWAAWIATNALSGATSGLYGRADGLPAEDHDGYVDALAMAASVERYSSVVSVVAAVLAILVVREVTALVRTPRGTAP